jgi:hypothetical protein
MDGPVVMLSVLSPKARERFLREFSFPDLHTAARTWGRPRLNAWLHRHYMTPNWRELVK